jgi:hypothetical protein
MKCVDMQQVWETYNILVGKPEGTIQTGRCRRIREDNIKRDNRKTQDVRM